jgi:hypothetical protein
MTNINCPDCGQYLGEGSEPYVGAAEAGVTLVVFPAEVIEAHKKTCKGKPTPAPEALKAFVVEHYFYKDAPPHLLGPYTASSGEGKLERTVRHTADMAHLCRICKNLEGFVEDA